MECGISFREMTEKAVPLSLYIFILNHGALKRLLKKKKEKKSFPLSDEGMDDAIAWLWDRFETEKSKWLDAAKNTMHIVNHA